MGLFVTLNSDHLWKGGLQSHTSGWLGAQWSPCLELSRSPSTSKSHFRNIASYIIKPMLKKKGWKEDISTITLCERNSPLTTRTCVAPGQFGFNLRRHYFHICQDQQAYTTTKFTTTVATHAYTITTTTRSPGWGWVGVQGCKSLTSSWPWNT